MNAGSLPEPYARYLHPAETAQFTADGEHCEHRGCRQPVAVVGWYYRRRVGRPEAVERFLCREHGEAFARRHHVAIDAAPAESEIPRREPAPAPGAALWGMSARQIAEHEAEGWHCDFPRCTRPARYLSSLRYAKGGRIRQRARFLCTPHAESFAARHGIGITAVLPPEEDR